MMIYMLQKVNAWQINVLKMNDQVGLSLMQSIYESKYVYVSPGTKLFQIILIIMYCVDFRDCFCF